jgi:DNA-binding MarR family transcriptional regulator
MTQTRSPPDLKHTVHTRQGGASHAMHSEAHELGHEGRAGSGDHAVLKLWLRLLASTTQIEAEIRRRLRERFDISLARFDYMAQLYRYREGLKMRVLSRYLMVTGGNVTGLTDDLERDGFVVREASPDDRRAWIVRLTPKGRRSFEAMAQEHEGWILELFSGLEPKVVQQLHAHLGALRVHLVRNEQRGESMHEEKA